MFNRWALVCWVMCASASIGRTAALLSDDRVQKIVCGSEQITIDQFNSFLPEERDNIIDKLVKYVLCDPIIDHGIVYDAEGRAHEMVHEYLQEAFFCAVASPFFWTWALAPLVARGAQLEAEYCRRSFALSQAKFHGDWENVAFAKLLGADGPENFEGRTALMQAAYMGNVEKVAVLIALGADIEAVDMVRYTALTTAAYFDYAAVVKLLVSAMANIEAVDLYERSAFKWAVHRGNEESVRVLIDGYRQQLAREKLTIEDLKSAECILNRLAIPDRVLVDRFLSHCESGDMAPADCRARISFERVLQQVRESIWCHLSDEDIINLSATKCGLLTRYAIEEGRARCTRGKPQKFTQFIQAAIGELNGYGVSYPMIWNGSARVPQMMPRSACLRQLLQDALRQGYVAVPLAECALSDTMHVVPMEIGRSMLLAQHESVFGDEVAGGETAMEWTDVAGIGGYYADSDEPAPKRVRK